MIRLGGLPGGEVFRGAYYLRAKLVRPARRDGFDVPFFTNMKYLLDHAHGLVAHDDGDFLATVRRTVDEELDEVSSFAAGTQIDHLLRTLQVCAWGMMFRHPAFLPLATARMTRTIYSLPPAHKQGGRLTKALTEKLYPELAWVRGVPTVRKTWRRAPYFWPEYTRD